MRCVILFRNTGNGAVGFVADGDDLDKIAVFDDYDDAVDAAMFVPVCRAFPFQIVELCDL